MASKSAWTVKEGLLDNAFIERLGRSVKQGYVYLNPEENGQDLCKGLKVYFDYYNGSVHSRVLAERFLPGCIKNQWQHDFFSSKGIRRKEKEQLDFN